MKTKMKLKGIGSEKWMMRLYFSTLVVVGLWGWLGSLSGFGGVIGLCVAGLMAITFALMYRAGKENLGKAYAKKNLIIAIILMSIGGVGFLLWPPLVYSEIRKCRGE